MGQWYITVDPGYHLKNKSCPHCEQAKEWRKEFLEYDHGSADLEKYDMEQYTRKMPGNE